MSGYQKAVTRRRLPEGGYQKAVTCNRLLVIQPLASVLLSPHQLSLYLCKCVVCAPPSDSRGIAGWAVRRGAGRRLGLPAVPLRQSPRVVPLPFENPPHSTCVGLPPPPLGAPILQTFYCDLPAPGVGERGRALGAGRGDARLPGRHRYCPQLRAGRHPLPPQ
jgi:hypothetical protein